MSDTEALSPEELVTLLEQENRRAVGYLSDEVSQDQDDNLDRYLGRPYGDEEDGSSNAMSMDVAEVVDWALPDLLEPFISGSDIAEFTPARKGDEPHAKAATELVNYVVMQENDGVLLLHDVAKTGAIQKLGVAKVYWEAGEKVEDHTFTGLPAMVVAEFQAESGVEIVESSAEPVTLANVDPNSAAAYEDGQSYTIKVKRTKKTGKCCVTAVPPEEFKVSQRAVSLDTAVYLCHETEKTRADLLAMGFDETAVMSAKDSDRTTNERSDTRFEDQERNESPDSQKLGEVLTLKEEYLRRGTTTVQAFRVGKTLMSEPVEVPWHPFVAWSPDRIPHRLIGLAIADKVKQTQRVKTVLTRQLLDNVYLANNPRFEVPDQSVGENTYDDLLTYRVGGLIRTKGPGGMLKPIEVPDRSANAMQAIVYMDQVREQQSGIVKNGMALSSEVIDAKSATESRRQDRNEQTRKRLMARMFGETFVKPLCEKVLKTVIKYQDFVSEILIGKDWREIDPRPWNADMKARCSVGLGHTNRDELVSGAQILLAVQREAQAMGMARPEHLFASGEKLVEGLGFRHAEKFFVDPSTPEGQQSLAAWQQSQAQNPAMAEAQGKLQIEAAKTQMRQQLDQQAAAHKAQMAQIEAGTKRQIAELQAQMDYRIEQMRIAAETQAQRERTEAEMGLAYWKAEQEHDLARETARTQQTNGNGVRFGGKVG